MQNCTRNKMTFCKAFKLQPLAQAQTGAWFGKSTFLGISAAVFSHSLESPVVLCTCLLLGDLVQSRVCMCFLAA